ncbi:MAG: hypothetical protein IJA58_01745, partial [Lachnospiraceae bacterium]|nr:hypothetical protein [Lachnospiraceae bacterium]
RPLQLPIGIVVGDGSPIPLIFFILFYGNGNLNWDKIIPACEAAGVRWAVVEHDKHHLDDDPFKSLKVSYDYLVTKGFC